MLCCALAAGEFRHPHYPPAFPMDDDGHPISSFSRRPRHLATPIDASGPAPASSPFLPFNLLFSLPKLCLMTSPPPMRMGTDSGGLALGSHVGVSVRNAAISSSSARALVVGGLSAPSQGSFRSLRVIRQWTNCGAVCCPCE